MANTDSADNETKREAVAKHELLDANGAVVERMELASGIRYTTVATGKVFSKVFADAVPGSELTMLALFGAKTLATNEASAFRQAIKAGREVDASDENEAIEDRFNDLAAGVWREVGERTRGPKYDLQVLGQCIVDAVTAAGGTPKGDASHYATRLADRKYYAQVRNNREVMAAYHAAMAAMGKGVEQKPVTDLA